MNFNDHIEKLTDVDELKEIIDAASKRIDAIEFAKKAFAINQIQELMLSNDLSLDDIPQQKPRPKVAPKYANPENPGETWSGRGREPKWFSEYINENNATREDLLINK